MKIMCSHEWEPNWYLAIGATVGGDVKLPPEWRCKICGKYGRNVMGIQAEDESLGLRGVYPLQTP
jgi:hypothetical protein